MITILLFDYDDDEKKEKCNSRAHKEKKEKGEVNVLMIIYLSILKEAEIYHVYKYTIYICMLFINMTYIYN